MKYQGTYNIPSWAVMAIEYADYEGLTDLEVELVNGFLSEFRHGYVADFRGIDEPFFSSHPAFGIASEVIETDFYEA